MSRRLSWRWDHCPTPYLTITSAVSANGSKLIVQWVIVRNRAGLTSGNLLHWKDRTKNRSHMLCLGQRQWSKAKFKSYQAKQWNLTLNVELINANQEKSAFHSYMCDSENVQKKNIWCFTCHIRNQPMK